MPAQPVVGYGPLVFCGIQPDATAVPQPVGWADQDDAAELDQAPLPGGKNDALARGAKQARPAVKRLKVEKSERILSFGCGLGGVVATRRSLLVCLVREND